MKRSQKPPVFIVGCARSGTTLLYHMLLSAGDFAVFRAESHAFSVLGPRFGNLRTAALRRRMMTEWLTTKHFAVSGLDAEILTRRVIEECAHTGDFLRLFMESIAESQGVNRWSDCTPTHVLYLAEIKRQIPEALIIHIIRDGRDVTLSYAKQGWVRPLPGDRSSGLLVAGLDWRWTVRKGRRDGLRIGADYMEVKFEDLVTDPKCTLQRISGFIDHPLDYERIRSTGIGSVSDPNTSFRTETPEKEFSPVGRWRSKLAKSEASALEFLLRDALVEHGYELETDHIDGVRSVRLTTKRALYDTYFTAKHSARVYSPLGRLTSLETLHNW